MPALPNLMVIALHRAVRKIRRRYLPPTFSLPPISPDIYRIGLSPSRRPRCRLLGQRTRWATSALHGLEPHLIHQATRDEDFFVGPAPGRGDLYGYSLTLPTLPAAKAHPRGCDAPVSSAAHPTVPRSNCRFQTCGGQAVESLALCPENDLRPATCRVAVLPTHDGTIPSQRSQRAGSKEGPSLPCGLTPRGMPSCIRHAAHMPLPRPLHAGAGSLTRWPELTTLAWSLRGFPVPRTDTMQCILPEAIKQMGGSSSSDQGPRPILCHVAREQASQSFQKRGDRTASISGP